MLDFVLLEEAFAAVTVDPLSLVTLFLAATGEVYFYAIERRENQDGLEEEDGGGREDIDPVPRRSRLRIR